MEMKNVLVINIVVFGIVALLHLWRAMSETEANIGSFSLPVWGSWIGLIVACVLVYLNWTILKKK